MSDRSKKVPLKRHFISLELKVRILDRLKQGEKIVNIARSLGLNEATIRTIQKNEGKIRSSVAAGCSLSANRTSRPRPPIIEKMEKALSIWIDDSSKKKIPLDIRVIKNKALKIYNYLRENGESSMSPDFVASNGWFYLFKKRFSLQNTKIQGESTSADYEAANIYVNKLQKIIETSNYTTEQVFNAAETGLWWETMPKRVAPGYKVSRDCVTLLMCSNASGDHIVKPMLVYRSFNPRVMKNINKSTLPVYYTANKKAWVTSDLFKKWFINCFIPSVENYLEGKNLEFKVLLILDNAPSHPKDLSHPNVEITFLPPFTASLIQPLDQGIISALKTHYIRLSLQWVLNKINENSIEVVEAWKLFTILDCIDLLSSAIKEIKPSTFNACWENIWPESVQPGNIIEPAENKIDTIIELAKSLGGEGYDDMNSDDFLELLIEEETDEKNLVEMATDIDIIKSEDDSTDENVEVHNFTLKSIQEGLNLAKQLETYFLNVDPSSERSGTFKREFHKCLAPYKEIHEDLSSKCKQRKITDCVVKVEPKHHDSDDEYILP